MKSYTLLLLSCCLYMTIMTGCEKETWENHIPERDNEPTSYNINGFIYRPAIVPATDANIGQLRLPQGFTLNKFADQLGKPRIIVVGSHGQVYYSDRDAGTVTMLTDNNNDGISDSKQVVASIPKAHGLAIHNNTLYIVTIKEVYTAAINSDGTLAQPALLLNTLPDGGQHPNRTIAFGPDGKMYITIGSTCNSCTEPNPLHATMVQANADGTGMKIFAKGLRNTIGFGWHPTTGELWGLDHGIDWLGDDEQKEEINLIAEDKIYGWPYIYGEGKYNPGDRPPGDTTYQQYLQLTTLPALTFQAHSAPMQMVFYTATQFPAAYRGHAFATLRGSWNRSRPSGYKVIKINFENGKPTGVEDFLTGFLLQNNTATFARLVGLAVHTDGSLLVGDDQNGVIYKVKY